MKIQAPTHCPCCSGLLERVKDQLFCKNPDCGEKLYKKIEHFAKTLKIKGLGPANIRKLDIRSFIDIYDITDWSNLGSDKVASKLEKEIEASEDAPLNLVLPALGIPLIGVTAADKLSKVVHTLQEVTVEKCKEAGLGEKATQNLMDYLRTFDYSLPFKYEFTKKSSENGVVCISGKLKSFKNKAEATQLLEAAGYTVKASLTKDVTILVNESGVETEKTKKAGQSGVTIVTNLKEFLGE